MDWQRWQTQHTKDLVKSLRQDPVFGAVGNDLKEAMIAHRVMKMMNQIDDPVAIQKFTELWRSVCKVFLPEVWGE